MIKSIYGLRQAPRAWYEKFSSKLLDLGFLLSTSDSSLFVRKDNGCIIYLLIYVDDIIITGNDTTVIGRLISQLGLHFKMKDLGKLTYFLGIEVQRNNHGLFLSQAKYITDLLLKTDMVGCKPIGSPASRAKLSPTDGSPLDEPSAYRSIVGALQYVTLTRPDICFAVNQVGQFMHAPTDIHMTAVKRILRFLKCTIQCGLLFKPVPFSLQAYCDPDWAGSPFDRRSTRGFCVFLGPNPISWSAKKQSTMAHSSTEAEYRCLAHTAAEVTWLCSLLCDLHIPLSTILVIWCDNVSAISMAFNPVFHARTKHIEIDYHFVREKVAHKQLEVRFISTLDQEADIFTKGLHSTRARDLQAKLCVRPRPHQLEGG